MSEFPALLFCQEPWEQTALGLLLRAIRSQLLNNMSDFEQKSKFPTLGVGKDNAESPNQGSERFVSQVTVDENTVPFWI